MSKKNVLKEAAQEILNASKKQGSQDAPKKLEGEKTDLGGPTPTAKNSNKIEYGKDNTEDNSKPKKTAKGKEPMKGLPTSVVPGQSLGKAPTMEETDKDDEGMTIEEALELIKESLEDESFAAFTKDLEETNSEDEARELIESVLAQLDESDDENDTPVLSEIKVEPIKITIDAVNVQEHLDALFAGDAEKSLSEDFKKKAATVLETCINAKVAEVTKKAEELAEAAVVERVEAKLTALNEKFDATVNYVASQWLEDNEVAIEHKMRTELTEDFIAGLRTLLVEHDIDLPEDRVDIAEDLAKKLAEVEVSLNEQISKNAELTAVLVEARKGEVINLLSEGLTESEIVKFDELTSALDGKLTEKDFAVKAQDIRETYFAKAPVLTEETAEKIGQKTVDEALAKTAEENDKEVLEEGKKEELNPAALTPEQQRIAAIAKHVSRRI